MEFTRTKKRITAFNAVSLTDIIFLLLVFFLLSSSFVVQSGIKVKLPKSDVQKETSDKGIIIQITKEEKIYINGNEVNINDLENQVRNLINEKKDNSVVIESDEVNSVKKLVEVMSIVRKAGGEKLIIATENSENK